MIHFKAFSNHYFENIYKIVMVVITDSAYVPKFLKVFLELLQGTALVIRKPVYQPNPYNDNA